MRKLCALLVALAVSVPSLCLQSGTRAAGTSQAFSAYAPGEVIVKLRGQADSGVLALRARSLGEGLGRLREELPNAIVDPPATAPWRDSIASSGLDRTFVLKYEPGADIDAIIRQLEADELVEYAEPNYLIELGGVIPDDPRFGDQWALRNLGIGVQGYPATLNADIKATEAWTITTGSPDVLIAVTDTGVDVTHPDLADNIYTNPREIAGNRIDDDNNGYVDDVSGYNVVDGDGDVSDIVGHGTQMAGIIAARTNNQAGISGVSQSKILPVKFFKRTGPQPDEFTGTVADAARALVYSVAAGASIINASWRTLLGGAVPAEHAQALRDAVNATLDAGALLVCIAGNEAFDNDVTAVYPGAYQLPNQIVVAASEANDEIWHPPFEPDVIKSGYGKRTVHLAAPGMWIYTTSARGSCVLCTNSSDPSEWYALIDGTSAAAAFVSGVAALVKSRYPDAYFTMLRRRILESVEVRESLDRFVATSGRLNAYGALTIELSVIPPVLDRVKYKGGSQKLILYGDKFQRGAVATVGGARFNAKVKGGDLSRLIAKVPPSAFPPGAAVEIRVVNPDGGVSQVVTLTR